MLIIVMHNMAIMSLQTHIHWEKNLKIHRQMFSESNYMKRGSTKDRLALVKTDCVSKYMLSVQKLSCS